MTYVSVDHLTMLDVSPPDWVTLAHECGFDAVGLRVLAGAAPEEQWPMQIGSRLMTETLARLRTTGMRVLAVEIVRLTETSKASDWQELLETGARLGAGFINLMIADSDFSRVRDNVALLAELARPYGLRPAVEPMSYMMIRTLQDAMEVVKGSYAGVIVDPLQLHRAGHDFDDVRDLDPTLHTYFQLCDAPLLAPHNLPVPERLPRNMTTAGGDLPLEARAMRMIPGEGELPLERLMATKPRALPVSLEAPSLAMRKQLGDRAFLQRARRSLDPLLVRQQDYRTA